MGGEAEEMMDQEDLANMARDMMVVLKEGDMTQIIALGATYKMQKESTALKKKAKIAETKRKKPGRAKHAHKSADPETSLIGLKL